MLSASKKIIIDTGFLVALFNSEDDLHDEATKVAKRITHLEWNTTPFVVQEIFWLLSKRKNYHVALGFLQKIGIILVMPNLPRDWFEQIAKILSQYSPAKIDLADASLVVLADLLKIGDIVSVDRKDFSILRWNAGKKHFHNLMDDK